MAVGDYLELSGAFVTLTVILSGGRWHMAKPPLPADAAGAASAVLNDVSCPAAGQCTAIGWYISLNGDRKLYADTLSGGTWTVADVPLPDDARPEQRSAATATFLAALTCTGVGVCVAAGQYRDSSGGTQAFTDTLSGGTWTATAAPLPGNAAAGKQYAGFLAIACPAPGTCVAGGSYDDRSGQPRYLIDTLSGGTWTAAAPPIPPGALADKKWSSGPATSVGGLACASADYCIATAGYVKAGSEDLPVIETLSGRTWTVAKPPLPANAISGTELEDSAFLQLAACPGPGICLAVGNYPTVDGSGEGLIETGVPPARAS